MKKQWQFVMMAFVLLASLVTSSFPLAQVALAQGTVRQIALKGSAAFPNAKGVAKYAVDGAEREFEIEIQGLRALAGTRLYVYVNGVRAGSFLVNSLGAGSDLVASIIVARQVPAQGEVGIWNGRACWRSPA